MKNKKYFDEINKASHENINALFTNKEQKKKFLKFYDQTLKSLVPEVQDFYLNSEEGIKCFAILVYLKFMKLERLEVETRLREAGYYGG